jgi:hypothetical protein
MNGTARMLCIVVGLVVTVAVRIVRTCVQFCVAHSRAAGSEVVGGV